MAFEVILLSVQTGPHGFLKTVEENILYKSAETNVLFS